MAMAGVFSVFVAAAMFINHFRVSSHDPLTSRALAEQKNLLRDHPTDETLKQGIRDLDLHNRERFFSHLSLNRTGAWLLLGGVATCLLAARSLAAQRFTMPLPQTAEMGDKLRRQNRSGRRAVAITGAIGAGLCLVLVFAIKTHVPDSPEALGRFLEKGDSSSAPGPTPEELRANWPQFRGPSGDGVATTTNLPVNWNGTNGEGIAWKTPVPLPGFGSPIVWQDRVFVSGGNETTRAVFCFSARDGRMLWQGVVPDMVAPPGPKFEALEFTGIAAPTPATDGRRVFAIFATGELAAFNFDGTVAWSKHLGVPDNPYGYATSLVVQGQKLFVQYDQGKAEQQRSRLYAYDTATGRVVWEQRRAMPSSWTTPLLLEAAGRSQLITAGEPFAISYDSTTGRELWRADCLGADLAPSPIFANDLLYLVHASVSIVALRVDGSGDVTKTHVAWHYEEGAPDIVSPVTDGTNLFALATWGTLTCIDARTGGKVGEKDLEMEFNASPILLGQRLLLVGVSGAAWILSADPGLGVLARAELGEKVHASPALVDGRLYLRAQDHLYAVGKPSDDPAILSYGR